MSEKSHVIRRSVTELALAFGACLAVAGCGGSPIAATTSGGGGPSIAAAAATATTGGGGSSHCADVEQAYSTFQADSGDVQALRPELIDIIGMSIPLTTDKLDTDIWRLSGEADSASSQIAQGEGDTGELPSFNATLEAIAKICGTTLTPWNGIDG